MSTRSVVEETTDVGASTDSATRGWLHNVVIQPGYDNMETENDNIGTRIGEKSTLRC